MKLCQRCIDAIGEASGLQALKGEGYVAFGHPSGTTRTLVPESECEFPVHKELNAAIAECERRVDAAIERISNDSRPTYGEWQTGNLEIQRTKENQTIELDYRTSWFSGTTRLKRWRYVVYPPKGESKA